MHSPKSNAGKSRQRLDAFGSKMQLRLNSLREHELFKLDATDGAAVRNTFRDSQPRRKKGKRRKRSPREGGKSDRMPQSVPPRPAHRPEAPRSGNLEELLTKRNAAKDALAANLGLDTQNMLKVSIARLDAEIDTIRHSRAPSSSSSSQQDTDTKEDFTQLPAGWKEEKNDRGDVLFYVNEMTGYRQESHPESPASSQGESDVEDLFARSHLRPSYVFGG